MPYELIRITCNKESAVTRLVLEGKLSGACVDELAKCWLQVSCNQSDLLIDLTSVSFIDDRGKQLLIRMHENGTKLVSSSLMSKCLIQEIDAAGNYDS
jgi:anti-anti-sigma regulatory factor